MKVKLLKFVDDPCFGKKFQQTEQCEHCWICNSCNTAFKNRKD